MKSSDNRSGVKAILILLGLWTINVLIVLFGWPFLVYSAVARCFTRKMNFESPTKVEQTKSPGFMPCGGSSS